MNLSQVNLDLHNSSLAFQNTKVDQMKTCEDENQ